MNLKIKTEEMRNGEIVKKLRKGRNFSLEDLADKSNLSISFLSRFERGTRNISIKRLNEVANALSISIVDLLKLNLEGESYENKIANQKVEILDSIISDNSTVAGRVLEAEQKEIMVDIIKALNGSQNSINKAKNILELTDEYCSFN